MDPRGKFGEQERSVRVARGANEFVYTMNARRRAAVIVISVAVSSYISGIADTREVVHAIDATTLKEIKHHEN